LRVEDSDIVESKQEQQEIAALATVTTEKWLFVKLARRDGNTTTIHIPTHLAGGLLKELKEALGDDPSCLRWTEVGRRSAYGIPPTIQGDEC
jgi:hypothetical protein